MIAVKINQFFSRYFSAPTERLQSSTKGDSAPSTFAVSARFFCQFYLILFSTNAFAENYATLSGEIKHLDTQPLVIYLEPLSKKAVPDSALKHASIISHDNKFDPAFQVLQIGSVLEISNTDPVLHNTHISKNDITLFNVATPLKNQAVKKILPRTGFFNVACDLHPWMKASMAVVTSPYYFVIWKPGHFQINNILPGKYQLHAMQADKDEIITLVTLAASDQKHISF